MTANLKGKRILVVEDEYFIASDLKRALLEEEAEIVGPVGQFEKGLALAESEAIDVAVLDINLDGVMTYPIADRLAARTVPWVFVTGYDSWAVPDTYREVPRVAKPFAIRAVVETVASLVQAPSS